jgi:hypothetical protein
MTDLKVGLIVSERKASQQCWKLKNTILHHSNAIPDLLSSSITAVKSHQIAIICRAT